MLFVFGKKAKKLRLNKISELIHNSAEYPDCNSASVSVYFQSIIDKPGNEYEVVPNSDFYITRTATRSNQSNYYINNKKSNFTEVTNLLKGKGIDLDNNRFLILQGEVEQISLMKPKAQNENEEGLLEYLEDIIGSNQYLGAIEEGQKQLDELTNRRNERVDRVKLAEKERDNLESAKIEAEAYLQKELEYIELDYKINQKFKYNSEKELDKKRSKQAALSERYDSIIVYFTYYN